VLKLAVKMLYRFCHVHGGIHPLRQRWMWKHTSAPNVKGCVRQEQLRNWRNNRNWRQRGRRDRNTRYVDMCTKQLLTFEGVFSMHWFSLLRSHCLSERSHMSSYIGCERMYTHFSKETVMERITSVYGVHFYLIRL